MATTVSAKIGGQEFTNIEQYQLNSSALTLVDTFSFRLNNQNGSISNDFGPGSPVKIYMSDPRVSNGDKILVLTGLVTAYESSTDESSGSVIDVTGADLGWHLVNSCGPLFRSIMGLSFEKFVNLVALDKSLGYGFTGYRTDNEINRKSLQGLLRREKIPQLRAAEPIIIPPICFEAGEMVSDKLITYARRAKRLVNVSSDGVLQVFKPNYKDSSSFALQFHRYGDPQRSQNNVIQPVSVKRTIDGLYTEVVCTATFVLPTTPVNTGGATVSDPNEILTAMHLPTQQNPHADSYQAHVRDKSALPFSRLLTFTDNDTLNEKMAEDRADQKMKMGKFNSWVGTYTIPDHVIGDVFITPDTMCNLNDTVNNEVGGRYVTSRRFTRSNRGGTQTVLELRLPNLLRA